MKAAVGLSVMTATSLVALMSTGALAGGGYGGGFGGASINHAEANASNYAAPSFSVGGSPSAL